MHAAAVARLWRLSWLRSAHALAGWQLALANTVGNKGTLVMRVNDILPFDV